MFSFLALESNHISVIKWFGNNTEEENKQKTNGSDLLACQSQGCSLDGGFGERNFQMVIASHVIVVKIH